MDGPFKPQKAAQVADVVAWAVSEEKPLEVVGRGTKRGIGRPAQHGATLDMTGLNGITLYEPEELVLAARAGTPMSEIRAELESNRQELAFEPPDLSRLLGGDADPGTIGGTLAANLAGPRRIKAGAARDHFLGARAVSGRGEMFKTGGRVVKNVTGYDLCKMLAGSWGTLAVMTDVTVKVLPAAETEATLHLSGLSAGRAVEAMSQALQSSCEVSGASYLPAGLSALSAVDAVASSAGACALRLEGIVPSVAYRAERLAALLDGFGDIAHLDEEASRALWREVRDVDCFTREMDRPVWRLSVAPTMGARVLDRIAGEIDARGFFDWGGGLIWLDVADAPDAWASVVRAAVAEAGGHATLIRAPEAVRAAVDVFQPQSSGLAGLSARLKQGFDPENILNTGRMTA